MRGREARKLGSVRLTIIPAQNPGHFRIRFRMKNTKKFISRDRIGFFRLFQTKNKNVASVLKKLSLLSGGWQRTKFEGQLLKLGLLCIGYWKTIAAKMVFVTFF